MAQFKEIDDYNFPFEIGVMRDRGAALKFADYLNSIGIKATAKPGFGANYSIYVANESDVSKAKLELLRFGNNPFAKAYNQAAWAQGKTPCCALAIILLPRPTIRRPGPKARPPSASARSAAGQAFCPSPWAPIPGALRA